MSRFCVQCGKPVENSAAFCTNCGMKFESESSIEPSSPVNANVPTAKTTPGSNRGVKVILAVVGGLVLLGGLAVGGVMYAGYRATSKAHELRKEYNVDSLLRGGAPPKGATPSGSDAEDSAKEGSSSPQRDVCSLVSKEEVSAATGTNVSEGTLNDDKDVCTFEPADDSTVTVVVDVKWHDGNLAMRALGGMSQQLVQEDIRRPVQGIGDEAYVLGVDEDTQKGLDKASQGLKGLASVATGPLVFRKGQVWVAVTATFAEKKAEVEKKIAAIVASRI